MPRRSNHFQRLVAILTACLGGNARVTESALLIDKITGEQREVDVHIESRAAGYEVRISLEVVSQRRRADTPWIERMHSKHASLPTNKLVLVSRSGFTKAASTKAKFYGIETLSVEEAIACDWGLLTRLSRTGVFEVINFQYTCSVVVVGADGILRKLKTATATKIFNGLAQELTFDGFVRHILDQAETKNAFDYQLRTTSERNFWLRYTRPTEDWRVRLEEGESPIKEIHIQIKIDQIRTPVEFASGKFRGVPFLSGANSLPGRSLHFVMIRDSDTGCRGLLLDEQGVRTLT